MPRKPGRYDLKTDHERATGYAGDGLSIYTHSVAHNRYASNVHDRDPAPRRPTLLRDMLAKQEHELKKLQAKLLRTDLPPDRLDKIRRDIEAKGKFIATLKTER